MEVNLRKSSLVAVVLALALLVAWEFFWRNQGYRPNLDDDLELWSVQRARIPSLGPEDTVLLGSSRVLFGLNLDQWESQAGRRPVMLATLGGSPLPQFLDLVNTTDFKGTIVLGVTPGLFYSDQEAFGSAWRRSQVRVEHYHQRTYADQLSHSLSLPLQQNLVLLSGHEEQWADDVDLKGLLRRLPLSSREPTPSAPFYNFSEVTEERQGTILERVNRDPEFARSLHKVWMTRGARVKVPEDDSLTQLAAQAAKKFKNRGGKLILLRCPSSATFWLAERQRYPRERFWDVLVERSESPGYHFDDYPQLKKFELADWSHLAPADAVEFTRSLLTILREDGHIRAL